MIITRYKKLNSTLNRKLTSFDEARRASASKELSWIKDLIFLKDAITVNGTAKKMKTHIKISLKKKEYLF